LCRSCAAAASLSVADGLLLLLLLLFICAVGFVMGMVFGILTRLFLRFMRCALSQPVGLRCLVRQPALMHVQFPLQLSTQPHSSPLQAAADGAASVLAQNTRDWCDITAIHAARKNTSSHSVTAKTAAGRAAVVNPILSVWSLTRCLSLVVCRYMGASHDQEVALTLGMAYLAYWVTGIPCKGSGEGFLVNSHSVTCRVQHS
jgi:hypothetical protein